jgi:hypothetical protein
MKVCRAESKKEKGHTKDKRKMKSSNAAICELLSFLVVLSQ